MQQFGLTGGIPGLYGVFLSFLGRYVRAAIIIQIIYIFLILNLHTINSKIHIHHPDECNGFAPFGNLSCAIYFFLFIFALTQAVVTAITIASGNVTNIAMLVYLWIVFPIATLFVFEKLVYQPHKVLQDVQKRSLLDSSLRWNGYYLKATTDLEKWISNGGKDDAPQLSVVLQTLDDWKKLDAHMADVNTWPISKNTLRVLSTLTNPFLPVLLPAVVEIFKNVLP
jgi:hypothetical protein